MKENKFNCIYGAQSKQQKSLPFISSLASGVKMLLLSGFLFWGKGNFQKRGAHTFYFYGNSHTFGALEASYEMQFPIFIAKEKKEN